MRDLYQIYHLYRFWRKSKFFRKTDLFFSEKTQILNVLRKKNFSLGPIGNLGNLSNLGNPCNVGNLGILGIFGKFGLFCFFLSFFYFFWLFCLFMIFGFFWFFWLFYVLKIDIVCFCLLRYFFQPFRCLGFIVTWQRFIHWKSPRCHQDVKKVVQPTQFIQKCVSAQHNQALNLYLMFNLPPICSGKQFFKTRNVSVLRYDNKTICSKS